MIIAESAIQLASSRTAVERYSRTENLTIWQGDRETKDIRDGKAEGPKKIDLEKELPKLKKEARALQDIVELSRAKSGKVRQARPADVELTEDQDLQKDINMRLLQALFERLTGRKFRMIDPVKLQALAETDPAELPPQGHIEAPQETSDSAGYGLIYDFHESRYEAERTDFTAGGTITTADGQKIDFSVNLSMSREFYEEQNLSIRAGDALKDPLVINFSGTAAQLTERNFNFDIDSDGTRDQIAFVGPGSGFLALDKNGDGTVNDGSELFGTVSGNGFADLARYDSDGNGWIDENDGVYDQLRLWTRSADGTEQLLGLGQAGVGALYLGHIETLFSMKNQENALLGQVRSTGLALMESGQAVTMQQLDLAA